MIEKRAAGLNILIGKIPKQSIIKEKKRISLEGYTCEKKVRKISERPEYALKRNLWQDAVGLLLTRENH